MIINRQCNRRILIFILPFNIYITTTTCNILSLVIVTWYLKRPTLVKNRYFYAKAHNLKYFGQVIVLMVYRYMQRFPIFLLGQNRFCLMYCRKTRKRFCWRSGQLRIYIFSSIPRQRTLGGHRTDELKIQNSKNK